MKNKYTILSLIGFILGFIPAGFAQFPGCPSVDAGSDVNLDCQTACVELTADVLEVGATNTYSVEAIPFTPPIAFNASGGTAVSVNIDDTWSSNINLPFDFCFYGQTYTQAKIGSNGAISLGTNITGTYHPWMFSNTIPSLNLGASSNPGNIFGVYHDIDPSRGGSIRYYLQGSAPCRTLIVVYEDVPLYSCTSSRSSAMMVLYETTNVIDVYVNEKSSCPSWNSGNSVIGIQNDAGTTGVAAPGRNTSSWQVNSSNPEAWRFKPDGASQYTIEWLDNGNVISTGATVNVCPSTTTTYTARATYTPCTGGNLIVVEDQVTVTPNPNSPILTELSTTPANCSASDGALEVVASNAQTPYQYSIDNGTTYQSSGVFSNLSSGSYNVLVEDGNNCIGSVNIIVDEINPVEISALVESLNCFGDTIGKISLNASNGLAPYNYFINGNPTGNNNEFLNLTEGSYVLEVIDDNNCARDTTITLTEPAELEINLGSATNVSCFGENDGEFSVGATGGTPGYSYVFDNSTPQNSTVFDSLAANQYTVVVIDDNGCTDTLIQEITEPAAPITEITTTQTEYCATGSIQITTSGVGNGTFSSTPSGLDLTTSNGQIDLGSSSVGTYDVFYAFTENGCDYQDSITIELLEIPELILEDSIDLCLGESWTPNASGDFDSYSWSSGLTQGVDTLGQLGNETFYVTGVSANGCEVLDSVVVSTFEQPNVSFTADPTEGLPPLNVTYTNTSDGVADTYTWDYGDGFDENTGNNTSHIFESQGIYFTNLIGSTIEGCFDTATVQINVLFPDMIYEIPNIFTPNEDNENDLFKLINPSNIEALEIIILNRWGNLVFESNDVLFEWNGKINNTDAECTTGTYFYKANLTNLSGEKVEVHGFVQLARD